MNDVSVVISQEVFRHLPSLPAKVQEKVTNWLLKFQADPKSPGINYETIKAAKDKNLRSVRIDQDWRGIILKPDQGNVFALLHVNKHDEAYHWAENKRVLINPVQGGLQIINTTYLEEVVAAPPSEPSLPPLFGEISDHDLVSLGLPEPMMPAARAIRTESDLDQLKPGLPLEAYEGLFLLMAGDSVEAIRQSRETRIDQPIDTEDFAAALARDVSRSRFYVVEGQAELEKILEAPLEQWRIFLHPTQRLLATKNLSGPARILGGAGTGKTVLAVHRAKYLAGGLVGTSGKVLFTTFTNNLAVDVEDALDTICTADEKKQIDVLNLDAWVYRFLRSQKYEHQILFDFTAVGAPLWEKAMTFFSVETGVPREFVREEFEQVVLAQGISNKDEYREAFRRGRGKVLSRKVRDALWIIFEEYRLLLSSKRYKEPDDAYRDAAALLDRFEQKPFRSVVVDETQDFGPQALKLIRAMAARDANDLLFVGDGHQRIYAKNRAAMSACGIDIRGRSKKLYLNYRTTEEIRAQGIALLEGIEVDDLDGNRDEFKRYKSLLHGPKPEVHTNLSIEAVLDRLPSFICEVQESSPTATVGVMTPTRKLRDQVAAEMRQRGLKVALVEPRERLTRRGAQVFLMTLHRAKGLEFDAVAVIDDPLITEQQRQLVYVGVTRAKRVACLLIRAK